MNVEATRADRVNEITGISNTTRTAWATAFLTLLCRFCSVQTLVVFDATMHFVEMTMDFDTHLRRFAIIAMTSLPQGVNRQILRNSNTIIKRYTQMSYENKNIATKKQIIIGTLLAMYYST